jgi:phage shock protein PspC (stress-responsive transcriptional regulator)
MNKVITINLGGTAYQLEDAGYDALRAYLDTAAARLQTNPDRDEIISDIEHAIGEKFRSRLSAYKNVIGAKEVEAVLVEMGPVEDGTASEAAGTGAVGGAGNEGDSSAAADRPIGRAKRLYLVREGAMLSGVCNGIAAYLNVDPTFVRLAFVLLTVMWGASILVYVVMMLVVPEAVSPEQKAEAYGTPSTAQEFIRRAKQGYYEAVKSFPNPEARRAWKRKFKAEMRDWRASFHREMAANAEHWRSRRECDGGPKPGLGVALPIFSLVQAGFFVLWLCAMCSLLATGALFGLALPGGLPVWIGVLVVLFAYGFLVWPLKMMRRACYYDLGGSRWAWPTAFFLDAVVWVGVALVLLWLATSHLPQVHEAVRNVPGLIHAAIDDVRAWWHRG